MDKIIARDTRKKKKDKNKSHKLKSSHINKQHSATKMLSIIEGNMNGLNMELVQWIYLPQPVNIYTSEKL